MLLAGGTTGVAGARLRPGLWLTIGIALIVIGVALAAFIERVGGVQLSDVRWKGPDGTTFSALLYRPAAATPQHPAPGVLAVHGYINTRETQDAFAIEFARRGYVVLALDQRGHGYSGGGATQKGFGGPEGLSYLRHPALRGQGQHRHGGPLHGRLDHPGRRRRDARRLQGAGAGGLLHRQAFAKEGTATWPRNLALVYSRFDEFAPLMWARPRPPTWAPRPRPRRCSARRRRSNPARPTAQSRRGTARRLTQPVATHPGDHISRHAVGDAIDWFAQTLQGGTPPVVRRPDLGVEGDRHRAGAGGHGGPDAGLFDLFLSLPLFADLRGAPSAAMTPVTGRWWTLWGLTAFVPALTYYLLPLGVAFIKPSAIFPQSITNALMIWAIVNVVLGLIFGVALGAKRRDPPPRWALSALIAGAVVAVLYLVTVLAGLVQVDFRFWVVALKPFSGRQAIAALSYVIPFTVFVLVASAAWRASLAAPRRGHYAGRRARWPSGSWC